MTFSNKSLRRVDSQTVVGDATGAATSRQISTFAYATDDAAATVETAGYFNTARDKGRLSVGSIILASMVNGGTPVLKAYVCLTVPATGNVTIGLQTTTAG